MCHDKHTGRTSCHVMRVVLKLILDQDNVGQSPSSLRIFFGTSRHTTRQLFGIRVFSLGSRGGEISTGTPSRAILNATAVLHT